MLRTIAILCFVTATYGGTPWVKKKGFEVKFNLPYSEGFIKLPQSTTKAEDAGWQEVEAPPGPFYDYTDLYCPIKYNYTLCVYYDIGTEYPVGVQLAFDPSKFTQILDWKTAGFSEWTVDVDGVSTKFYATQQYFTTPENLQIKPSKRPPFKNSNTLLPRDKIYVKGFNGELYPLSTTIHDKTNKGFLYQTCYPGMGAHHYFNMTPSLQCTSDQIFPWFLLGVRGKMIGCAFHWLGHDQRDLGLMEYANGEELKVTIKSGPKCLYNYANQHNYMSLHIYYVEDASQIPCPV